MKNSGLKDHLKNLTKNLKDSKNLYRNFYLKIISFKHQIFSNSLSRISSKRKRLFSSFSIITIRLWIFLPRILPTRSMKNCNKNDRRIWIQRVIKKKKKWFFWFLDSEIESKSNESEEREWTIDREGLVSFNWFGLILIVGIYLYNDLLCILSLPDWGTIWAWLMFAVFGQIIEKSSTFRASTTVVVFVELASS